MNDENLEIIKTVDRLAAARSALFLTGLSPRELGKNSQQKVIKFVYRFGYTSADNINQLLGRTKGGYAHRLVKQGYLVATKTMSGNPKNIYTLTETGIQEAVRHSSILIRYVEIDPYKIDQRFIRHNLLVQKITINALTVGALTEYQTERMLDEAGDKLGKKRPDVVWTTTNNSQIAIEIELTPKWQRDLDDFIIAIICALASENNKPARFDRFMVCSDSPAIIKNYSLAMQPNAPLNIWAKNQRGHWVVQDKTNVPDWLIKKVDFRIIE